MAKKLRVGIVGCGGISRAHAQAYQQDEDVKIVWVYDVAAKAAAALAQETGAQPAASLEQMAAAGLDAVSICSPPAAHAANCRPFLKAGVAILCEKPLEVDAAAAARLARAVKRSRAIFMTAFCHRFHPAIIELKRLIERGRLGRPLLFRNIFGGYSDMSKNHRANPRLSGGGCLVDHGCHSMDLFRYLVGDPTYVQAVAGRVMQDLAVEDFGTMLLSVKDRAFGEITTTYSLPVCGNWVEWYGTKGTAVVSYWNPGEPDLKVKCAGGSWEAVDCSRHPGRFVGEIRHFLACVRSGRMPSVTVDDGLAANRIARAVYESVARGRRVAVRC